MPVLINLHPRRSNLRTSAVQCSNYVELVPTMGRLATHTHAGDPAQGHGEGVRCHTLPGPPPLPVSLQQRQVGWGPPEEGPKRLGFRHSDRRSLWSRCPISDRMGLLKTPGRARTGIWRLPTGNPRNCFLRHSGVAEGLTVADAVCMATQGRVD